jgi:hypothetical protein
MPRASYAYQYRVVSIFANRRVSAIARETDRGSRSPLLIPMLACNPTTLQIRRPHPPRRPGGSGNSRGAPSAAPPWTASSHRGRVVSSDARRAGDDVLAPGLSHQDSTFPTSGGDCHGEHGAPRAVTRGTRRRRATGPGAPSRAGGRRAPHRYSNNIAAGGTRSPLAGRRRRRRDLFGRDRERGQLGL